MAQPERGAFLPQIRYPRPRSAFPDPTVRPDRVPSCRDAADSYAPGHGQSKRSLAIQVHHAVGHAVCKLYDT